MDTHRLKYFLRIAEHGSITRAAESLGVAQPALSRQVRLLEEELGITLFRRTRRGVDLTEEGERLRAATAAPLNQLERAVLYAGSPLARLERGLRLGLPPTTAEIFAAPMLTGLHTQFPRVGFHVTVADTDVLIDKMLAGCIDIALINPVPDNRLFCRPMLVEELVAVGGPDSGLRADRPLTFTQLVEEPLVMPDSGPGIATTLHNAALRFNVRIDSHFVTASVEIIRELAAAGAARAVLPRSACRRALEDGRLRYAPICEPTLTYEIVLATTAQLTLPRQFCVEVGAVIREAAEKLTCSGEWPAESKSTTPWIPERV